jgi:ABC-type dipeptide/oligopeptide/nickel transport system ATPase component
MSLLEVSGLKIDFATNAGTTTVVDGVSFDIEPGETLGLVGESGSGKSVTSRAIMRLIRQPGTISEGRVLFQGRDVLEMTKGELATYRAHDVAMVFQDPFSSLNPVYRVGQSMSEILRVNHHLPRALARRRAVELLGEVGIPQPDQKVLAYPHELSGGMRQRVMIAMAMAGRPKLLLADEPTTALDVITQKQILELMRALQRESNAGILLVSHDFGVIAQMCDRVAVMRRGKVVETGSVREITRDPHHPYTQRLLAAVPRMGPPTRNEGALA